MCIYIGFPLILGNRSGKSQEILNRLEKSGKITQNTGKVREFQKDVIIYFLSDI